MGRKYSITFNGTYTNAGGNTDLLEILPADDKPVKLKGFVLSQTSEVGDAAEENIRVTVLRLPATVTSGSGGSTPTAPPPDSADSAFGGTPEANNTTVATTSGTAVTLLDIGWNERNTPFDFWFPEGWEPKAKQGEGLVIRGETTPADDLTFSITAFVEEE